MRVVTMAAPVRHQVVEVIRRAITSGRFAPGARLVEKDLCEVTGVSRPSVREALRQLETEGLIEIVPNRGPFVARLSKEMAAGIYQVRGALEGLAARNFASFATDAQIEDLKQSVSALVSAYSTRDVGRILDAKRRFYDVLLEGASNPVIRSVLRTLNDRITLLRRVSLSSPDRSEASIAEIRDLLDAICRRDAEGAHDASIRHIEQAAKAALQNLE